MKWILYAILFLLPMSLAAQNNANGLVADKAFAAWQAGEKTGDYHAFRTFLSDRFNLFSHPLLGQSGNQEARIKLENLIAEREIKSNNLDFTDIQRIGNENKYVFLFNSAGAISGGYPYKGFNAIVLTVENQRLTGFQEYFGFIDPNWFKN